MRGETLREPHRQRRTERIPLEGLLGILYACTIFVSAFLLFQVQPIIAKLILPWFGGSSAVWSTCMLFFQVTLLSGYVYAHLLQRHFAPRWQAIVHFILLGASLLALPVAPNPAWKPSSNDIPSLRILGLLVATVGLPYFVVSTTSSLIQSWYSRTHSGAAPYRLFALSNFASLLALLSYPLVVERFLPTYTQANVWSVGYVCFALLCATSAWMSIRLANPKLVRAAGGDDAEPPPARLRILWVALAGCASLLMLAVTTFLTQDVAAIPFLWIVPLVVYLLSFILSFETQRFYRRPVFLPLVAVALLTMALPQAFDWRSHHIAVTIIVYSACLFVCCMFCHGEVASLKPHPRYLTGYYVMVSMGGAIGGLFVGLIAPNFFNAYHEFPIGLALCALLVVLLTPLSKYPLAIAFVLYVGLLAYSAPHGILMAQRNFYGQIRVGQDGDENGEDGRRFMVHGMVNHGHQMLNVKYRNTPTAYYCPESGLGRLMAARTPGVPQTVGVLGLGCGTLAAFGRAGDIYRLYEINPQVVDLANRWFTYLKDTPAHVETVLGDGRLSLEREPDRRFHILVMDAYSGDSIPVHLITREAFEMYARKMKPGGVIAVNISNKYLDLRPVIERLATHLGKIALYYSFMAKDKDVRCQSSLWVLLADPSIRQSSPALVAAGEVLPPNPEFRMWTDDFSNMLPILR